ncbi:MAG: hypothetical protein WAL85_09580 [Candidatus Korobacteraceae bacterium]
MAKPVRFHQHANQQADDSVQKRTPGANVEDWPERSASRKALPTEIVPEAMGGNIVVPTKEVAGEEDCGTCPPELLNRIRKQDEDKM